MLPSGFHSKIENVQKKIEEQTKAKFGFEDAVVPYYHNNKQRFSLRCIKCSYKGRSLESHLIRIHKMGKVDAKEHCSGMVKTVKHLSR